MAKGDRVDPSRLAAYDVLKAVRLDDAYANLALPQVLAEHKLAGRDAAFTTELVSGTIRWQGTYDAIIDACLTKPRLEAKVRDALRLGVHQLLAMRVPGPRGDQHQRRPRPRPGRRRPGRADQRGAAQGERPRPRRLDPARRAGPGERPGGLRLDRPLPPALGRRGARRRARLGRRAASASWRPTTPHRR